MKWIIYKNMNKEVIQKVILIVLYQQHQGGVPEVPKAYLQCAMDKYR